MTNTTGRILIPVELLRRSTRLRSAKQSDATITTKVELGETPTHPPGKRRKLETSGDGPLDDLLIQSELAINERLPCKVEPQRDSPGVSSLEQASLVPDGILRLDEDELNLERTLMGGQSFRWKKHDQMTARGFVYTGIVQRYVFQLWRPKPTEVAFKILNKLFEQEGESQKSAQQLLEDYFQVEYKLEDLYEEWSTCDEHFAICSKEYKGFRILRQDPVENVLSFICATNNNIKRISQMVDKLCKNFGENLENRDENKNSIYDTYQSFPCVERLAQDDVFECLRYELGFGYRAKYITETAKKLLHMSTEAGCKSPREYLLSLRSLDYKETRKQLMQLSGIGRKVADCICLMSMDHLKAVPIDCHIYEIVCRHYMPNLRNERKTLTDNVHDMIGQYFYNLHGPLAGWSTSVLFIGELKHLQSGQKDKRQSSRSQK